MYQPKIRITKKVAKAASQTLLSVGYCRIQTLIMHLQPYAYSAGVYGWSCDYYALNDKVVISTGYRPIGHPIDTTLCDKYEAAAQRAYKRRPWDDAQKYVSGTLLPKFIHEALDHK